MEPIILVAVGFIFSVIGLILGFGISAFLRRNAKTPKIAEPETTPLPPTASPSRFTPKESVELLSVWRNDKTHKLLAILDGKPLSPVQLAEGQRDRLSQILSGLHTMIEEDYSHREEKADKIEDLDEAQEGSENLVTEESPGLIPEPHGDETGFTSGDLDAEGRAKKVFFADTLPPPVSLRTALGSNPFKINVPSSQKPSAVPKSIIEQIDEVLQEKLAGTPLAEKEIKLEEIPDGMAIRIGALKYEGIDAVPDPTIRALIKESAREWNEKVSRKRGS